VFYWDPLPDVLPGIPTFEVEVSSTSGLPVTLEVVSGPALVEGHELTVTGVGTVVLRASQAGVPTIGCAYS